MAFALRLLGLSARVQAQRCVFQKMLPLRTARGSTQEAAGVRSELRRSAEQRSQINLLDTRAPAGGLFWKWKDGLRDRAPVDDIRPEGFFPGHSVEARRDYPDEGYIVTFELEPHVPFKTVLLLDAATQGLRTFDEHRLAGEFFFPDVRKMARSGTQSYNTPWPAFARELPGYPFVDFDIVTKTQDEANVLKSALRPYASDIAVIDQAKVERPHAA